MKEKITNAIVFVLLHIAFVVIFLVSLFSADDKEKKSISTEVVLVFLIGIQIIMLVMITARIIYSASVFWCLAIGIGVTFLLAKATILRKKAV